MYIFLYNLFHSDKIIDVIFGTYVYQSDVGRTLEFYDSQTGEHISITIQ